MKSKKLLFAGFMGFCAGVNAATCFQKREAALYSRSTEQPKIIYYIGTLGRKIGEIVYKYNSVKNKIDYSNDCECRHNSMLI